MSPPTAIVMPATSIASPTNMPVNNSANVTALEEVIKVGAFTIALKRVPGTASIVNAGYAPTVTQTMDCGMGFTITFTADLKEILSGASLVESPPTPNANLPAQLPSPPSTPVPGRRNTLPSGFRLDFSRLSEQKKGPSSFVLDSVKETDGSDTLLTPISQPSSPIFPASASTDRDFPLPDVIETKPASIEEDPAHVAVPTSTSEAPASTSEDGAVDAIAVTVPAADHTAVDAGSSFILPHLEASQGDLVQEVQGIAASVLLPEEPKSEPQNLTTEGTSRTETDEDLAPSAGVADCGTPIDEGWLPLPADAPHTTSVSPGCNVEIADAKDAARQDDFSGFKHTSTVEFESKSAFIRKESLRACITRKRAEQALKARESGDAKADVLWYAPGLQRGTHGCNRLPSVRASHASESVQKEGGTPNNIIPACTPTSDQHAAAEVRPASTPRPARRPLRRLTPSTEFRSQFIIMPELTKLPVNAPKKKQAATFKGIMKGLAQRVSRA